MGYTTAVWAWAGVGLSAPGAMLRVAVALGACAAVVLCAGYAGFLLRLRPLHRLRGHLEVRGPDGEALGRLPLPPRREVTVGAAGARTAHLRLPWLPGADAVFTVQLTVETAGRPWVAGLSAWRREPAAEVWTAAVWPYHLYAPHSGLLPRRRVDLDPGSPFSAAGLTFIYHTAQPDAAPPVADLLSTLAMEDTGVLTGAWPADPAGASPEPRSPGLGPALAAAARSMGAARQAWHAAGPHLRAWANRPRKPRHARPARRRPTQPAVITAAARWVTADLAVAAPWDHRPDPPAAVPGAVRRDRRRRAPIPYSAAASPANRAAGSDVLGFLQPEQRHPRR